MFDIMQFIRTNKVIAIWTAFAGLLYLFKDMFGLVFITYVMCFISHGLTRNMARATGLKRPLMVVVLYLIFLALVLALFFIALPRILHEAKNFADLLPATLSSVDAWLNQWGAENPTLAPFVERLKGIFTLDSVISQGWTWGKASLDDLRNYFSWFLLGLLFSFLIMLDLPHLARGVRNLKYTRLAAVYDETAASVILFAKVVGENFRAQILVATVNTALTAICLHILGIGSVVLLCSVVFICGLIPVLGVFISSVPIVLVAINTGGVHLGLWAVGMIVLIHLIETYILNPRIVSAVMHINPVMTLLILYIAHSLIGLWGMLLGVPISVYIYRQITGAANAPEKQNTEQPAHDRENSLEK